MSCELTFLPTDERPDAERVREFFDERRWYEVESREAAYHDEDTGVAFRFRWSEDDGELEAVHFEMEFVRPRYFGLEAAGELEALVAEFALAPREPGGEGEVGSFSVEGFVDGWDRGNRAAVASADEGALPGHRLAGDRLRDAWRWNRARQEYQTVLGEGIFVPSIRLLADGDEVHRACVWPETIPFALPDAVDLVLLSGLEHEGLTSEPSELRVADREAVANLIELHAEKTERRSDPTDHLLVGWAQPPREFLEELAELGAPAETRELERLSPRDVLDAELLD